MPDIVHAFLWRELLNNLGDGLPEFISCTRGRLSEQGLQLGEGQLDGIEVKGIGRQIWDVLICGQGGQHMRFLVAALLTVVRSLPVAAQEA